MPRHLLFLTGHLAERRLRQVLEDMEPADFTWEVRDIGVQVAALMTADLIRKRLSRDHSRVDGIMVPGHCRGDLDALAIEYGVPIERGPEDLHDLPAYFGRAALGIDLKRHNVRIFAEIIDAPLLSIDAILATARSFAADGADVIDLGCLPDTPFDGMETAIAELRDAGFAVSVDSANVDELRRAGRAGAEFILSLDETKLNVAADIDAVPILVPARAGDLDSLCRAAEVMSAQGREFIVDSILDPIPFGFSASLVRYAELRRRLPQARILMGIGNLTELTDADTTGISAALFGIIAELGITDVLAVQKSPHCRTAIREADRARRLMHAATSLGRLPVGIDASLLCLRDRKPWTSTAADFVEMAHQIRDPNFRIGVSEDGIHIFNRDGHHVGRDAFELFPKLGVEADAPHAFYLGVELAKAQIAWELGKRYVQDEDLDWGCAVDRTPSDLLTHRAPGPTLELRKRRRGTGE